MAVIRSLERCATVIGDTLDRLVATEDQVEWDVCTSWSEWECSGHADDEADEEEHEPHPVREQVLCLWISLAAPETESSSTCQWMMPLRAATNDCLVESITETWSQLSFARRAYELKADFDDLASQLDDGSEPGP